MRGGWPTGASGVVRKIEKVQFRDRLELDFAVWIGDELFIAHRPARHEYYLPLGEQISAVAVLPAGASTDAVLAVTPAGLTEKRWSDNAPYYTASTVDGAWSGVEALWVHEQGGGHRVYGYDPLTPSLRRKQYSAGSWSSLSTLSCPAGLRDVQVLDFDATVAGREIVMLFETSLMVRSASSGTLLASMPATATDHILALPGSGPGGLDVLVWCTDSSGVQQIAAINASYTSETWQLGNTPFNDIVAYDYDGDGRNDVLLPSSTSSDARVLICGAAYSSTFFCDPSQGDTVDTAEISQEAGLPPIVCAAAGDHDLDGYDDLVAVHAGESELRFVLTTSPEVQRLLNAVEDVPTLTVNGSSQTIDIDMSTCFGVMSHDVHVQLYVESPDNPLDLRLDTIIPEDPVAPLAYSLSFSASPFSTLSRSVYWISFTTVDLGPANEITHRYPTRLIAWSPADPMNGLVRGPYPQWQHNGGGPDNEDTTGFRRGTRTGSGSGQNPGPPPP